MNLLTVYCRTSKGSRALSLKNKVLPPSHILVLTKTDGKLDAQSVMQAIRKLTEYQYTQILIQLINDGFVIAKSDFDETSFFASNTIHSMVVEEIQTKQFFDTSFGSAITRSASTAPVASIPKQAQAPEGKAWAQAELDAEAENIVQVKAAIDAKLKLEAEAEAEAEKNANAKAEADAKAKAEAEEKAEADAKAKAEAEASAKAKAEAEAEAEKKSKAEEKAKTKAQARAEAKAKAEALVKAEAEKKAKAEAEAVIAAILAKHQTKRPQPNTQHIDINEQAFGDTFTAIDDDSDRWYLSDHATFEIDEERGTDDDMFQNIATSNEDNIKTSAHQQQSPLLKGLSFTLHYLVTLVTRWLAPTAFILSGLLAIIILLSHIPLVMSPWIDSTEKRVSRIIGERVKIHQMRTSLFPTPHLWMDKLDIGEASDIQIKSVSIKLPWDILTHTPTTINQLELSGLTVTPSQTQRISNWFKHSLAHPELQISKIALTDVNLQVNQTKLPSFNAVIHLNRTGEIMSAQVALKEVNASAEIVSIGDDYKITINAQKLTSPIGAPIVLQALKADGIVNARQLNLTHMHATLYGGTMEGSVSLDWTGNWLMNSKLNIQDASLESLAPNFIRMRAKGDLNAEINFSARAKAIESLFNKPSLKARFTVGRGELAWIGIIRAIQVAKRNMAINGTTQFDQVSGQLTLTNRQYAFDQILLKSGNMRANGAFTVQDNQQLKGNIRVNLDTPSRNVKSTIQLAGSIAHPQIR